jgi:hypothetical protein
MPFPWYHPAVPPDYARTFPAKSNAMYLSELEQRAALLFRLRYSAAHAKQRLQANVRWDFELHQVPDFIDEIDRLVDRVYGRGGPAGGPPEP